MRSGRSWIAAVPLLLVLAAQPAAAHPHLWIVASADLTFDSSGAFTGVKFAWEFDEAFSAVAILDIDADGDGTLSPAELTAFAKTNIEALKESDYFTFAKVGSRPLAFAEPTDYGLERTKEVVTLHFVLPAAKPEKLRGTLRLDVYDPTVYIGFSFGDGDAVKLAAAPPGCTLGVERPSVMQPGQAMTLSESFFNSLSAGSNFGSQFANRVTVKCP